MLLGCTSPVNVEIRHCAPGSSLPAGWRWARLGEMCQAVTGTRNPATEPETSFHYVDITSVDNAAKRIAEAKTLLGREAPSRARQIIRTDDVILSTTRPNLNAVALVPPDLDGQICSTGFCVLRCDDCLDPRYLFLYVQGRGFVDSLSELVKGALYPAVTDKQVREQPIPLPPLPEQKRIAAVLTEQMRLADRARAAVEAQLEAARTLPAAYLRAVFNSPEAKAWPRKRLGGVCEIVARQVDPKVPEFGALPHVSGEDIESGLCRIGHLRTAAEDGMISGKYLFEAGAVLYSKLRPYLRKVAVAEFRGLCSADMYPVRVNRDVLDPVFTAWLLLSEEFTSYADSESRRARMPKLNREQLFAWEAPIPSVPEQQHIASMLTRQREGADALRTALEERLASLDTLPAALLRLAFRGGV